MSDMLVDLLDLELDLELDRKLILNGIEIKKAIAPDKSKVERFALEFGSEEWKDEVSCAFASLPVTCFIAVKNKEIIGFACYESTSKCFFGPTAVHPDFRKMGIGKSLLLHALIGLREIGYCYGIIGWPSDKAIEFYQKCVGAKMIENKRNGIYRNCVKSE
jgi:GNAT superfamily N-acetyltransferase